MGEKGTEKKGIVEIKDGKVEVTPDNDMVLGLTRTYKFEEEEVSTLDLSGLVDIIADDVIKANNIMANDGAAAVIPENTLYFALIIASFVTGMPVQFFKGLKPKDAFKVKRYVSHYFFGED